MKRLAILGSTGSIGTHTSRLSHPSGAVPGHGAAADGTWTAWRPRAALCPPHRLREQRGRARDLRQRLGNGRTEVVWGERGLLEVSACGDADMVVSAIAGGAGLLRRLRHSGPASLWRLANKESLVMAADCHRRGPGSETQAPAVDSEHSAIFQCLSDGGVRRVRRLILTASGGPFRARPRETFASIMPEEALRHPNWQMGKKVTIDSAR